MEQEARIDLELAALLEEKEAKIKRLAEANAQEMAKLDENRSYIAEVARTAAEIEAMTTGEEDEEHNAKAASKRLSTFLKASMLSGKQKQVIQVQDDDIMLKKKKKKSKRRTSSLMKRMPSALQRQK